MPRPKPVNETDQTTGTATTTKRTRTKKDKLTMSEDQAKEMLLEVLFMMRNANDYGRRYGLWAVAESLVTEWRDLDTRAIRNKIRKIQDGE